MAKHSVNVLIKARDQASKKFRKMSKATNGLSLSFKKLAGAAAIYLSGRAIKNFAQESLQLFATQQDSVNNLRASLALIGQQYTSQIEDHKKWASSIQQRTKYGDEALLDLMSMGAAMGKMHGEELQNATKAAVGLASAYRLDLKAAMRLVARARVGDTASLKRYGITLDAALNDQEKFNKVIEIGTNNFKLAEAEAKTYAGAVQQMKNAVGDVREEIGEALAPAVQRSAKAIKTWAEDNQKKIGEWADMAVDGVLLVKDVFFDFVDFMKKDWQRGLSFAFDSFLTLLKATFDSAVELAISGGKGIWAGLTGKLDKNINKNALERLLGEANVNLYSTIEATKEAYRLAEKKGINISDLGKEGRQQLVEQEMFREIEISGFNKWIKRGTVEEGMFKRFQEEERKRLLNEYSQRESTFTKVENIITKAGKEIAANAPRGLAESAAESFAKYQERLTGLTHESGIPGIDKSNELQKEQAETLKEIARNTNPRAREGRFLTFDTRSFEERNPQRLPELDRSIIESRKRRYLRNWQADDGMSGKPTGTKTESILEKILAQLESQNRPEASLAGNTSVRIGSIS